ncbi:MAG: hypothetical protein AMXMBFR34_00520 [Myxococcaceae bacterium]
MTAARRAIRLLPPTLIESAHAVAWPGVGESRLIYLARHKSTGAPTPWRADTTRLSGAEFESEELVSPPRRPC